MSRDGLMGEFADAQALLHAARSVREAGYVEWDAFTPYPLEELSELVPGRNRVPLWALLGGITGASLAFLIQTWAWVWDYPIDVGGKPLFSWPAFIPITFEMLVLFSALSAGLGMLAANGLPLLYHPVFEVPGFARASRDRFFLWIRKGVDGASPDLVALRAAFVGWGALEVHEIPLHPDLVSESEEEGDE
jgi:hypothetical protein